MNRIHTCLSILLLGLIWACQTPPQPEAALTKAIWITRWDYTTAEDVEQIVNNCAEAGFNELLFQVRGNATCFFPSSYEPWAAELGGTDPGFDPLGLAVKLAHERGMKLHAWVNVVPAWWGASPPADPNHVVHRHPEWLWIAKDGTPQPYSERFYVSLNPCLPEVRAHVVAVLEELLERYSVDGLHLDYIRFPNELTTKDYPRDDRTLELYRASGGQDPDAEGELWNRWRADQITRMVADIREAQLRVRPGVVLSAAVSSEAEAAYRHFQDWPAWIQAGLVDALYPMNYAADEGVYSSRVAQWMLHSDAVEVRMGVHAQSVPPRALNMRLREALEGFGGYAVFGYLSLWDSANNIIDVQDEERSAERAKLRGELLPI